MSWGEHGAGDIHTPRDIIQQKLALRAFQMGAALSINHRRAGEMQHYIHTRTEETFRPSSVTYWMRASMSAALSQMINVTVLYQYIILCYIINKQRDYNYPSYEETFWQCSLKVMNKVTLNILLFKVIWLLILFSKHYHKNIIYISYMFYFWKTLFETLLNVVSECSKNLQKKRSHNVWLKG